MDSKVGMAIGAVGILLAIIGISVSYDSGKESEKQRSVIQKGVVKMGVKSTLDSFCILS